MQGEDDKRRHKYFQLETKTQLKHCTYGINMPLFLRGVSE